MERAWSQLNEATIRADLRFLPSESREGQSDLDDQVVCDESDRKDGDFAKSEAERGSEPWDPPFDETKWKFKCRLELAKSRSSLPCTRCSKVPALLYEFSNIVQNQESFLAQQRELGTRRTHGRASPGILRSRDDGRELPWALALAASGEKDEAH